MTEPTDGSRGADRSGTGESSRVETALAVVVAVAVLFVVSAAGVALILL
jgi:hypothetical protein